MMTRRSLFAAGALLLLFRAREARADAVPPPPKDCPPGTLGVTGHAGPGCVPDVCPPGAYGTMCEGGPCCVVSHCGGDAGGTCGTNYRCEEVKVCTKPRNTIGWGASRHPVKEALAPCDAAGACPGGGTCEALTACLASSAAATSAPAKPKGGCGGCAVAEREAPPGVAFGIVLAASAARRRRRYDARVRNCLHRSRSGVSPVATLSSAARRSRSDG
jgi:MYXO-CTERM domain-containing protein